MLLLEGKGGLGTGGNEYVGEAGGDVLGCASVVEGSLGVAVTVESGGAVDGSEDCVCVFLLVVSVLEVG